MSQLSPETLLILALLKQCHEQNRIALLTEIHEISKKRHHLSKALEIVKREYGYCFSNIVNTGYQPLENTDKVIVIAQKRHNKIKNQVNYWQEEWQTIDTTKLDDKEYKNYLFASLKLTAYQYITSVEHDIKIKEGMEKMSKQSMVDYDRSAIAALIDVS